MEEDSSPYSEMRNFFLSYHVVNRVCTRSQIFGNFFYVHGVWQGDHLLVCDFICTKGVLDIDNNLYRELFLLTEAVTDGLVSVSVIELWEVYLPDVELYEVVKTFQNLNEDGLVRYENGRLYGVNGC